jgi:hypothetical protein
MNFDGRADGPSRLGQLLTRSYCAVTVLDVDARSASIPMGIYFFATILI